MSKITPRSHVVRPFRPDASTVALYSFSRPARRDFVPDRSGSGLDLKLEGARLRDGKLELMGEPGCRAICADLPRISKAMRKATGLTVEMWLSPSTPFQDYRPREHEEGAAPSSLGDHWGDVIFSLVADGTPFPLGAKLRYNPDVLFWAAVAAHGKEHARGPWFRTIAYLPAPLFRTGWHHVAFAWEKDAVHLYVDGVELGTGNSPGFQPPTGPLILGCDADGGYPFKGTIRELRISRVARPRSYFRSLFPRKELPLRLPRLLLAGAPASLSACMPPMHRDDNLLLPLTRVVPGARRTRLRIVAAPGVIENATFALRSARHLRHLVVTPEGLACGGSTIPSGAVDVLLVKCVYHTCEGPVPPNAVPVQSGKKLVPKVLLHDDALVKVDLKKERNAVRVFGPDGRVRYYETTVHNPALAGDHDIRDAEVIQPVDLGSGRWQQFWIKVRVPSDAKPGIYRGGLRLQAARVDARVELELQVLPIELADPVLDYSIYYQSTLVDERTLTPEARARGFALCGGGGVFPAQMARHLRDMKDHGVTNPSVCQRGETVEEMIEVIEAQCLLRRAEGMSTRRLYFVNRFFARTADPEERKRLLRALWAAMERLGWRDIACYVVDEPKLSDLERHAPIYREIRDAGIKTFAAVDRLYEEDARADSPLWRKVKECISVLIAAGKLLPELAAAGHAAGMEIY
ncbi:MAG: LamG-like jellyroll fold domain-containing protein, partial [Planctomycetota bacterium]